MAIDSYELGVDIQIDSPCNLGVLLQELGKAGRKPGSVAKGLLLFNEVIDDKRLGLWLKSALESKEANASVDRVKSEMIHTYVQTWIIYSLYHGKCLARSLTNLYGGASDVDPPTCFVSNSPLCAVSTHSDDIIMSVEY